MTAADEYQRVLLPLVHCPWCDLGEGEPCHEWGKPVEHMHEQRIDAARHVAQALAADPGVRAAVEREARAEALREFRADVEAAFPPERFPREWVLGEDRRSGTVRHVLDMLSDRAARLSTAMTPYRQEPSDG